MKAAIVYFDSRPRPVTTPMPIQPATESLDRVFHSSSMPSAHRNSNGASVLTNRPRADTSGRVRKASPAQKPMRWSNSRRPRHWITSAVAG